MPYKFENLEVWQLALDYIDSQTLAKRLQNFRNSLTNSQYQIKEEISAYEDNILE